MNKKRKAADPAQGASKKPKVGPSTRLWCQLYMDKGVCAENWFADASSLDRLENNGRQISHSRANMQSMPNGLLPAWSPAMQAYGSPATWAKRADARTSYLTYLTRYVWALSSICAVFRECVAIVQRSRPVAMQFVAPFFSQCAMF